MLVPVMRGNAAGVVLASGSGSRVGAAVNKVYLPMAGRHVLTWSLDAFASVPDIGVLVLVTRPGDRDLVDAVRAETTATDLEIVHGGQTRQDSELAALRSLAGRISDGTVDTVLIHDGARPLVRPELIAGVLDHARAHGGAIPALEADDVVAVTPEGAVASEPGPGRNVRVQTPQGFRARPLLEAYENAAREGFVGTDTASCMERFSALPVGCVAGEAENIKVTYPHDLAIAEHVLATR